MDVFMFYFITIKSRKNSKIFTRDDYFYVIKDCINFYTNKQNFNTIAFVLMPDHLHWLIEILPRVGLSNPTLKNISWDGNVNHNNNAIKDGNFNTNRIVAGDGLDNCALKDVIRDGLDNPSPIQKTIKSFKGYTGKEIIKQMRKNSDPDLKFLQFKTARKNKHFYSLWQKHYHVRKFNGAKELINKINYIKQNPMKEKLGHNHKYIYVDH